MLSLTVMHKHQKQSLASNQPDPWLFLAGSRAPLSSLHPNHRRAQTVLVPQPQPLRACRPALQVPALRLLVPARCGLSSPVPSPVLSLAAHLAEAFLRCAGAEGSVQLRKAVPPSP